MSEQVLYYDTGEVKSRSEVADDGTPNGTVVIYYKSGAVQRESTYAMGESTGTTTSYDEDGSVTQTVTYVDGRISLIDGQPIPPTPPGPS
tara:strand:+ start:977 stop:1246 length:270 start_codon:yes stop_codon:yes gene_type:complete